LIIIVPKYVLFDFLEPELKKKQITSFAGFLPRSSNAVNPAPYDRLLDTSRVVCSFTISETSLVK
jgi:hypothetical protein